MAGIYIHIPFCKQACYYCDFHFSTSLKKKEELIAALKAEILLRKEELYNEIVDTIYFGGGTPSLLSLEELNSILAVINVNFNVNPNAEITLEANPDDLSENKIVDLANSSINRLSIGIQSFFEDDLKFMNRAHNAGEAKNCLTIATKYFDNITIDLIYGVPNLTSQKWRENLQRAFDFGVPHISSYALTVEEKTALANFIKKGKVPPVDDKLALEHFNILVEETKKKGFIHYEISNFGKPEFLSKHNTSYWLGEKYMGIGPSAHGFNGKERYWNVSNNAKYIKAISIGELPQEIEILSLNDLYNEYIMTGLRTMWGISFDKIENEFGKKYIIFLKEASRPFLKKKLLKVELDSLGNKKLLITEKGKFLSDGIASDLFIV